MTDAILKRTTGRVATVADEERKSLPVCVVLAIGFLLTNPQIVDAEGVFTTARAEPTSTSSTLPVSPIARVDLVDLEHGDSKEAM